MSDKFLNVGGSNISISNGTATIFGSTIGAINLNPSQPLKTNSVRQLVSEKLDIADVNNLSSELTTKSELNFIESDVHTAPPLGQVKIYAKTDGSLYKQNDAGIESGLGGGGGVATSNPPVVNNAVTFFDGTTGTLIKEIANFNFISGGTYGDQLRIPDISTDDHASVDYELQKISNFQPAVTELLDASGNVIDPITTITGELDVLKIKSYEQNAEIFLNNNIIDLNSNTINLIYSQINGVPFDLIFTASDEVNSITTTGQKMSLRVPQNFTTSKIKISVNSIGGAGFSIVIKKNGVIIETIPQGNFLVSNTINETAYTEDDIITLEVSNVGSGTATGLKCYLIGKTS